MNIIKVLGAVVAVHGVAYLVIAQPGCRSTASQPARAAPEAPAAAPIEPAPGFDDALNPATSSPSAISVNFPLAETTPVVGERYAPTRPGSEAAVSPIETVPATTYTVKKGDSFYLIARKNGITVDELTSANNMTKRSIIRPGQKLVIPAKVTVNSSAKSAVAKLPEAPIAGGATYTVKSGDTLSKIASRHHTTTKALRALNSISGDFLRVGQVLTLPGSARDVAPAAELPPAPAAAPVSTKTAPVATGKGGMHTVSAGENATLIARRYGISVDALLRANQINDPRKIRIGQVLTIPGTAAVEAAPPPPSFVPDAAPATVVEEPPLVEPEQEAEVIPMEEDLPVVPLDDAPPAIPAPRID